MVRRFLALATAALVALGLLVVMPTPAGATAPTGRASEFYFLTNGTRAQNGVGPLAWDQNLANTAQAWANYMASSGDFRHDPNLTSAVLSFVPSATNWGENIAWVSAGQPLSNMQANFMASGGHAANVLSGTWDRVGIGYATASNGRQYVAVRFAASPDKSALGQNVGSFDGASSPGVNKLRLTGWVIDPDTTGSVQLDIRVNGVLFPSRTANASRTDVGSTYYGYGNNHGFDATLTTVGGTKQVCVEARNLAGYGTTLPLGCKTVWVTPDLSGPFYDVGATHPFAGSIQWLVDRGITTGFPDKTFRPTAVITRHAFATFLWRYAGQPTPAPGAPTFSDVPTSHPAYTAIRWMAGEGIASGFGDGTFRPTGVVTREAVSSFLWRFEGQVQPAATAPTFSDVPPTNPFTTAIRWMADEQITTGFSDGTFKPSQQLTRQAVAAFLQRLSQLPS